MSRLWLMTSSPLVRLIVWPARLGLKTIVSPGLATAISARSDPAPLSRLFRTVSVLSRHRSSSTSRRGRQDWRLRTWTGLFTLRPMPQTDLLFRSQLSNIVHLLFRQVGLRYNENAIAPGAQTERRGEAGPVSA